MKNFTRYSQEVRGWAVRLDFKGKRRQGPWTSRWRMAPGAALLCLLLLSGAASGKSFECPVSLMGTFNFDFTENCTVIVTTDDFTITGLADARFRYTDRVELGPGTLVDLGSSLTVKRVPDYTWFTCASGCHYSGQ